MKKFLQILLFTSLLFLGACSSTESVSSSKETLRLNLHAEPPTLDPRKATDSISLGVIKLCFEGLCRANYKEEIELALAEAFEQEGLKYTFFLKKSYWSDGVECTAFDFEKTWKKMLDPGFACHFASDLYILKNAKQAKSGKCSIEEIGVKALDARTLVIHLEHPAPYLLELLSSHAFLATASHVEENQLPFVCNGPFQLMSWQHHSRLHLDKNLSYWDKEQIKIENIQFSIVENETTEFSLFENKELDWVGAPFSALPLDALATIKERYNLITSPLAGVYYYSFNTRIPPFNNVNFRKALTLAINRQAIVENILQNGQIPATAYLPKINQIEASSYFDDHDEEKARQLFQLALAEMGLTKEELPVMILSYNTMDGHHKIAQAIQEQWHKSLGFKVELENIEWKVFLNHLHNHQFQIARMGGLASYKDPVTFFDHFLEESSNDSGWENEEFTRLLKLAEKSTEQTTRISLLKDAERILMEEMPIAPIHFYTQSFLLQPHVKGVYLSDIGEIDVKALYLEKE